MLSARMSQVWQLWFVEGAVESFFGIIDNILTNLFHFVTADLRGD